MCRVLATLATVVFVGACATPKTATERKDHEPVAATSGGGGGERPTKVRTNYSAAVNGTRLEIEPLGMSVDLASGGDASVWEEILTERRELRIARVGSGEWKEDYAITMNATLDHRDCVAQFGLEPWDEAGSHAGDLYCRIYVVDEHLWNVERSVWSQWFEYVEQVIRSRDYLVSREWESRHPEPGEASHKWSRIVVGIPVMYIDHGGIVYADLRSRMIDEKTVVLAFMYSDECQHLDMIDKVLEGVRWRP